MSTPIRRAIYGKLSGDGTLTGMLGNPGHGYSQNIYFDQAPQDAEYPFVVFSKSSGIPTEAYANPTALQTDVWMVKAVDKNTTADIVEAVQSRVQTLLNDATLSVAGATLVYLRRQSDVQYPELMNGVEYKHAGGLYRVVTA